MTAGTVYYTLKRLEAKGYVMLPAFPGYSQGLRRAGPYGGYLGPKWDPVFSAADTFSGKDTSSDKDFYNPAVPLTGEPRLPKIGGELTLDALNDRRSLVQDLERLGQGRARAQGQSLNFGPAERSQLEQVLDQELHRLADLAKAKLGPRFGRMDLLSQLALLSVEWLGVNFEEMERDRIGV